MTDAFRLIAIVVIAGLGGMVNAIADKMNEYSAQTHWSMTDLAHVCLPSP